MIWYSHVNEDSSAEMPFCKGFQTCISIVGSGERLIALLDNSELKQIYAIDINMEAIELLKLKLIAIAELEIQDYLGFIGAKKMERDIRLKLLKRCLNKMDESSKLYWNQNQDLIPNGILFIGHFEQFLARIRPILKLFLGNSFFNVFHNDYQSFPSLRWRIIKFLFSNKIIYKMFGNKDQSFVGAGVDLSIIPNGFQDLIDSKNLSNSFMAHLVFKGSLNEMDPELLPPSQRPEVLKNIQDRLRNKDFHIAFVKQDLLEFLNDLREKSVEGKVFISMSDVLSFEKTEYVVNCVKALSDIKDCDATFVIRSYLNNHLKSIDISRIKKLGYSVKDISNLDKTNMYRVNLIRK